MILTATDCTTRLPVRCTEDRAGKIENRDSPPDPKGARGMNFAKENKLDILGLDYSPIKGPEGNIEYLIYLKKTNKEINFDTTKIDDVVNASHNLL